MEYIAAALEARGHRVTLADLRFSRSLAAHIRAARPALVGIAAMHALETDDVLALARRVRALSPDVPIVIGGHTAAAYPEPFLVAGVDRGRARRRRAGAAARLRRARSRRAADDRARPGAAGRRRRRRAHGGRNRHARARRGAAAGASSRRRVAPAVRVSGASPDLAGRDRARLPVPLLVLFDLAAARARRCASDRSTSVCRDFASVGDHVFVADDLFWHHPSRSLELARELRRRGIRKQWILVQSRVDLVARHPELLEAWRPLAQRLRHLLRPRGGDRRRARRPDEGRDRRRDRARHRGRAAASATASPATS